MAQTKKINQQRLWLNVIIIATAFMILLFTVVGKLMEDQSTLSAAEYPFANLSELRIGNWHVKQTNQQCVQSQPLLTQDDCLELIQQWRTFQPTAWVTKKKSPVVLSIVVTQQQEQTQERHKTTQQLKSAPLQIWQLQLDDRPKLSYQPEASINKTVKEEAALTKHALANDILLTDKQLSFLFPRALLTKWLPQ